MDYLLVTRVDVLVEENSAGRQGLALGLASGDISAGLSFDHQGLDWAEALILIVRLGVEIGGLLNPVRIW